MVFIAYIADSLGVLTIIGNNPLHNASSEAAGKNSVPSVTVQVALWIFSGK